MSDLLAGVGIGLVAVWLGFLILAPGGKDQRRACRGHYGVQQIVEPGFPPFNKAKVVCKDGTVRSP